VKKVALSLSNVRHAERLEGDENFGRQTQSFGESTLIGILIDVLLIFISVQTEVLYRLLVMVTNGFDGMIRTSGDFAAWWVAHIIVNEIERTQLLAASEESHNHVIRSWFQSVALLKI
jgi:membrane protein YqaA with SNARE-associated domain